MTFRTTLIPIVFSAVTSVSSPAVEIVAHRGASHDAPENTLPAFRLGWEQKADACELDAYLTRDGKIAVIHDPTTKSTAGLDRKVAEQTLEELRKLDAGIWKGPQWKGGKIPSLEEVLAIVPEGKKLLIEIKCGPEILPELVRVIGAAPCKPEQLVVIGFNYKTVTKAKVLLPKLSVQWIARPKKDSGGLEPTADVLIEKARAANLDGLNLESTFPIDSAFVARFHAAKLTLHVWTVDTPADARRFRAAGVDGITTNRPALIRETFQPAP
jgi:glycerophosphoryl diester phosphodiesterase